VKEGFFGYKSTHVPEESDYYNILAFRKTSRACIGRDQVFQDKIKNGKVYVKESE
jgi:hypothetical protein